MSQRAAWASPLFYKMVVVTVRPSLSSTPPSPPGFIKGHKQVGGDIIVSAPPPAMWDALQDYIKHTFKSHIQRQHTPFRFLFGDKSQIKKLLNAI